MIWALGFLLAINVVTFAAFAVDKRAARLGNQRIAENTLLKLALLGGSPGAKLAQARFRHKTVKQPFARMLNLIIGFQVLALLGAAALAASPGLRETVFAQIDVLFDP